jgi:hypothetical protein
MSYVIYAQQHPLLSLMLIAFCFGFLTSVAFTLDLAYRTLAKPFAWALGIRRATLVLLLVLGAVGVLAF